MKLKNFINYKKMWEAIKENTDIEEIGNAEVILFLTNYEQYFELDEEQCNADKENEVLFCFTVGHGDATESGQEESWTAISIVYDISQEEFTDYIQEQG